MAKNITTNQKAQVLQSQVKTRILLTINLDSGPLMILSNDTTGSLTIGSNNYLTRLVQYTDIDTSLDGTTEKMTVSISNVCQDISSLVANSGDVLINRYAKIEEVVFNGDSNTIVDSPILLFDGIINNIALTATSFMFDIERKLRSYGALSPNMIYDVNCQFVFKDNRCQYTGTSATCSKTFAKCEALSNVANFGGFPSIISQ